MPWFTTAWCMSMHFASIAAEADIEIFDALADLATIDGVAVRGVFRAPWLQPQIGGMSTGLVEPQLIVLDRDAASAGSAVEHGGRTYTVVSVEPDGTGLTTLVLREVVS